jgi:hypothetical protein
VQLLRFPQAHVISVSRLLQLQKYCGVCKFA